MLLTSHAIRIQALITPSTHLLPFPQREIEKIWTLIIPSTHPLPSFNQRVWKESSTDNSIYPPTPISEPAIGRIQAQITPSTHKLPPFSLIVICTKLCTRLLSLLQFSVFSELRVGGGGTCIRNVTAEVIFRQACQLYFYNASCLMACLMTATVFLNDISALKCRLSRFLATPPHTALEQRVLGCESLEQLQLVRISWIIFCMKNLKSGCHVWHTS